MDLLCAAAQHDPVGYLAVNNEPLSIDDIARISGISKGEASTLLGELERTGVFSRNRRGVIYSRRMVRDYEKSQTNRKNGQMGGNPSLCNGYGYFRSVNPPDNTPLIHDDKPHMPEARLQKEEKQDSCRIADAIPTSHSAEKEQPKKAEDRPKEEARKKARLAYDSDFETFWKLYPTTRNMSKKEAWDVWRHLSPEDKQLAVDSAPKFANWLKAKGDKAPETIHACRFLSKRRFEGHAQASADVSPTQFYATFGSTELEAWDAYGRMTKGTTYPRDKRGGWSFPSRWPPDYQQTNGVARGRNPN